MGLEFRMGLGLGFMGRVVGLKTLRVEVFIRPIDTAEDKNPALPIISNIP